MTTSITLIHPDMPSKYSLIDCITMYVQITIIILYYYFIVCIVCSVDGIEISNINYILGLRIVPGMAHSCFIIVFKCDTIIQKN